MKTSLSFLALLLLFHCAAVVAQQGTAEPAAGPPAQTAADATPDAKPDLFIRDRYRIDPVVCPFKGKIDYKPGEIECGLLEVPENREDPDSRYIELHFVRLNSRWGQDEDKDQGVLARLLGEEEEKKDSGLAPGKRDDPVIYLTGGPGALVSYYVKRFKDHGILDHRDMYILEQRGIGSSGDFCPFYFTRKPAVGDVATFAENLEAGHQRLIDCATNARAEGVDLAAYNTVENARDVKALRLALGIGKWNVWGISYGTILGQAYIKEDPEAILAVALDPNMPLDIQESELYWRVAHWYDRDLQKLQEICNAQPACARAYPNLGGRLRGAVLSVVDNPIEVAVEDTENFPSGKARFFQDIVAFLPFLFLYEQDNYPALPGLIYAWADAVERRDETLFRALAAADQADFVSSSEGMHQAVFCNDGDVVAQARASKKDLTEYPVLGAAFGDAGTWDRRVSLCDELGMPPRPTGDYAAVHTDLPSLIIEGEMDPITPPPNARAILPGFANGSYVEFPFAGHGPSRSVKCAGDMLNKFYDHPSTEPDLACVDEMEAPQIWAPMYTSDIVPRLMLLATGDKKKLAVPGAWLGGSLLIALIAFVVLTFGPVVRVFDGREAVPAGGARFWAWLAATASIGAVGTIGAAAAVTAEASEMSVVFGFVPWAVYGAWAGFTAGLLGLLCWWSTVRARRMHFLPGSQVLGFLLTGAAAMGICAFLLAWDLQPF